MKVLFLSYIPSPYRLRFFSELGKECELTVLFEKASAKHRDKSWKNYEFINYRGVILDGFGNSDYMPRFSVKKYLNENYDHIVVHNPSTPTGIYSITYMKKKNIPYWIEGDGGFVGTGYGVKETIKRYVYSNAYGYFSTCSENDKFFIYYGADPKRIHRYPFTSLSENNLVDALDCSLDERTSMKELLGMTEKFAVLSVGSFSYENGYGKDLDNLIKIACQLRDIGFYIVGDEPTKELLEHVKTYGLNNVHFIGFKKKEELAQYYIASDLFVLLAGTDEWGLVINEAMAFGLPVIITTKCNASLELVHDSKNGYIVEPEDLYSVIKHMNELANDRSTWEKFSASSKFLIRKYSIENLATVHSDVLWGAVMANRLLARKKLRISQRCVVLAIGQVISRKGFEDLLHAMANINSSDIALCIIGGTPTDKYLSIIRETGLANVFFTPYMSQEMLKDYFRAANLFVLPTHEDIWGLVINEAMRFCLPVVTTNKCGSGLELIQDGFNGIIVNDGDVKNLESVIRTLLYKANLKEMALSAFRSIKDFTIENMARKHKDILEQSHLNSN